MKRLLGLGVLVIGGGLLGALGAGCGGSDASTLFNGDGGAASGDAAATGDSGTASDSGGGGGGGDGGGGGGGNRDGGGGTDDAGSVAACAQTKSLHECTQCCGQLYPQGQAFAVKAETDCSCQATTCLVACKTTLCATQPTTPDATCASCVKDQCISQVQSACAANAQCAGYEDCANTACKGKQ